MKNYVSFDSMVGDWVYYFNMLIEMYGGLKFVFGKIGQGIKLNGNRQVVDFGEYQVRCFGNLDNCNYGVFFGLWFNLIIFRDNMYFVFIGKNGIIIRNIGSCVMVIVVMFICEWLVNMEFLFYGNWYFLEVFWDLEKGLELYINDNLVDSSDSLRKCVVFVDMGIYVSFQENKFYLG